MNHFMMPGASKGQDIRYGLDSTEKLIEEMLHAGASENRLKEEDYNNKKIWDFNWDFSRFNKFRNISVGIDAETGDVISYFEGQDRSQRPEKLPVKSNCRTP